MSVVGARACALLLGASSLVLIASASPVVAQQDQGLYLDPISVLATKTPEKISDILAPVSSVRQEQLELSAPGRVSQILYGTPGVGVQERVDDPGTAVNIRGMQDFGRVNVVIDGARQNFQRTGHNANGVFYVEPELLAGVDVARGPSANVYGSGAIGGVVSFTTKDVDDILKPGQKVGVLTHGEIGSNRLSGLGSTFVAVRANPNIDFMVGGTLRSSQSYKDANGVEVANSGSNVGTGIAKMTLRPADGHQVKLGYTDYDSTFLSGQPFTPTTGPLAGLQSSSIFDTRVRNQIATARWLYSRPDDRVFDFDGNVYWTKTSTDQRKIAGLPPGFGGIGNIGDMRNFTIDTVGFDIRNSSRFDTGALRHVVTFGADGFRDDVNTSGFGVVFTPSGQRTVSGGFAQMKSNYSTWLEVIGALRYDNYGLEGGGISTSGQRLSPKITVGITPVAGITPYVTYAEGYRAPAVTETLVAGVHPVVFAPFQFLPNPTLKPETGKTSEAGLNLKYDSIFRAGDGFRAKFNVFRNDVSDYINLVGLVNGQSFGGFTCTVAVFGCQQYQNVPSARLDGVEFESNYDAGLWFVGLAGSRIRGREVASDRPLSTVPPDSLTTTLGGRFLDRKLIAMIKVQTVAAKPLSEIPITSGQPVLPPTGSYNLVNFYSSYQVNRDVTMMFSVENLFNQQYARYSSAIPNPTGSGAPIAQPSPGITVKGGLKVQFGDDYFKRDVAAR